MLIKHSLASLFEWYVALELGWSSESASHSVESNSLRPHGLYSPRNSPGQNTGVGSLSLLQEIFLTQESNQGLLHCMRILYQLSYRGVIYIWIYILQPWDSVPSFVKSSPHRTIVRIKGDKACQTTILVPDIHWDLGNVSFYVFFENPILGQRKKNHHQFGMP